MLRHPAAFLLATRGTMLRQPLSVNAVGTDQALEAKARCQRQSLRSAIVAGCAVVDRRRDGIARNGGIGSEMMLTPFMPPPLMPGLLAPLLFPPCAFPPFMAPLPAPVIMGKGRSRGGRHRQGGERGKDESTNTHSDLLFRPS